MDLGGPVIVIIIPFCKLRHTSGSAGPGSDETLRRQGRQFVSERSSTLAGLSASFYGGPIRRLTWLMLIAAGAARP
ncbi:hypothetical protein MHYP_G00005930 [Metynnis hypsauchen]